MTRRQLLRALGVAPLAHLVTAGAIAAPSRQAARVTVTGLEIFRVRVNRRGNWVFVRLQTSAGVTGIGEASHGGQGDPQIAKLREYGDLLRGRSIYDLEWLRDRVWPEVARHGRAASSALSGLDQALVDVAGQVAGVPAYQLLGGRLRDRVRQYANINRSAEPRDPAGFAAMAGQAVSAGFDAVKLAPFDGMPLEGDAGEIAAFTRGGIEALRAVRAAIGPEADLLVDAHDNFDVDRGLELAERIAPLDLFWLEEVSPGLESLASINAAAAMPTAGGESLHSLAENVEYLRARAADILMPDIKYCGGMLALKKVAAIAEGFGAQVSPHGPAGPVANMAAAHVCVGLPNFLILELAYGEVPWRGDLIDPPEPLDGGVLRVPDRPGLGITLNEKTVAEHAIA